MRKTLDQNWNALKANYETCTRLNLWVDYHRYTTTFSTNIPLTQFCYVPIIVSCIPFCEGNTVDEATVIKYSK